MTNRVLCFLAALVVLAATAAAAQPGTGSGATNQLRALAVDAGAVTGAIRSFQGVNGPPYPVRAGLPNLVKQYRDLRIDTVRTHDSYGPTEIDADYSGADMKMLFPDPVLRRQMVDAARQNSIFKDWSADPGKPESYNFGPTDKIVEAIKASGAQVYYRVGRSAGGNQEPPKDLDKFAAVTAHIAMHYNQGWAHGMHAGIRYWEIWNEPQFFWSGTPQQFYAMYDKVARALRAADPTLKIGTDATATPLNEGLYREDMLDYIKAHDLPLDFYSWHTYADMSYDPYDALRIGREIRQVLDKKGFTKAESILSEWNLSANFTPDEDAELGSMENAAFIGSVMMYLQDSNVDAAHLYRGDTLWMGLFNKDGSYRKPAYAYRATGRMMDTPERLSATGGDTQGFNLVAGRSRDGKRVQILVCNYQIPATFVPPIERLMQYLKEQGISLEPAPGKNQNGFDYSSFKYLPKRTGLVYNDNRGYTLTVKNLPWGAKATTIKRYRLTKTEDFALVEEKKAVGASITLQSELPPPGMELIVLEAK